MSHISLWNTFSYVICEFSRLASWYKSKSIIKVRSSFQISKMNILVSYSRLTYVNANMSFSNSNFEGNFSTYVFSKSFWDYLELKIDCWTLRNIYSKKILNNFVCVEVIILVGKRNVYLGHIFSRPLLQPCRLETTSLCLNTPLLVNKKFPNSHYFIEINVNVCLLCAHHVMTSIIFILEDLTVNKKSVTNFVFMFHMNFIFRILRSWKARFSHHSISPELCTHEIKVVGGQ